MKLSELVKSADWKSEKHVPVIHVKKEDDVVNVSVSIGDEIAHPNTLEHHIAWMKLFFVPEGKEIPVEVASYVASAHGELDLFTEPSMSVKLKGASKGTLLALSYCNIHGLWENSEEL